MRAYGITNAAPYASAPAVGAAGDTYFNTTSKQLFLSDGTVWIQQGSVLTYYWFGTWTGPAGLPGNDVQQLSQWSTTRSNGFSLASTNSRITPVNPGRYQVTAQLNWQAGANAAAYTRCILTHYNAAGVVQSTVSGIGNAVPANGYGQAVTDAEFDMLTAGDYVTVTGAIANTTGSVTSQAFCSVVPVGGAQGLQGPDIAAAQSSYFYGHLVSPASIPGTPVTMGWTTDLANNISLATANNVTINQAGKYRVAAQVSTQTSGAGGSALTTTIIQFASGGATKVSRATVNPLPSGASQWGTAFAEAVLDCVVGDYIQVTVVGTGATSVPDPRSWIEITPVGGTKGDVGPAGSGVPPGGTARQLLQKTSATDYAVGWRKPVLVDAGVLYINQSISGGGADFNICSVSPAANGWVECAIGAAIEYGFGGTISSPTYMFYCNQVNSMLGGALQTPSVSAAAWTGTGGAAAGTWVRGVAGLNNFIIPVSGGGGPYVPVFRWNYAPSGTNCWINVWVGWKLYES